MAPPGPPEYVLYLRKSVGRTGIARQRTITAAHIERLGGTIIAEFADTDRTAFRRVGADRPERPQFDAMIAWLRAHPGTGVAAWHLDRLTRDNEDTELVIRVCAAGKHRLETPSGGTYDPATATGRKRVRDDSNTATYEVDHMVERITAAKLEAVAAGEDLGGRRKFGWRVERTIVPGEDKPHREFRVDPAEAAAIRDGTRWVAQGIPLGAIARRWNAAGVTTSTGRLWGRSEVGRVLRRARNAGLLEHLGQVAGPGNWPAIVTEDEWRRCVAILSDPVRRTSPGAGRRWLGSGLYLCGVCGGTLVCSATGPRGGRPPRPVYRCGKGRNHVARDAHALDDYIGGAVTGWLTRFGPEALLPPDSREEAADIRTEVHAIHAQLRSLADHQGAGDITMEQLVIASRNLRGRLVPLEERERQLAAAAAAPAFPAGEDPGQVWADADLAVKQGIIRLLMTVTVLPAPNGRPPGHRPGERYFQPDYIGIDWLQPF